MAIDSVFAHAEPSGDHWQFFIFSLASAICKKYTNTNGNDSKDTNAINISIIWSCGGGVGNAGNVIAWIASSAGSFIAWIVSISATFFYII